MIVLFNLTGHCGAFPSAQAVQEFMTDGRRQALAGERDRVIARTDVIDVQLV